MEQKTVKIISLSATTFGCLQALELDFEKFKTGLIAFKGVAGAGKTTTQNAIKQGVQGRASLADASQYGDEWETETQLIDGERRIYIGAKKKKDSSSIVYSLHEKDDAGKKVMTPVIDGMKATPSKYMELISTELTFGIKEFLSDNKTTHRNFMFQLFRDELAKFGVVLDKNNPDYEKSILGVIDGLTEVRDNLRARCTHEGAFVADFERDGHTAEGLGLLKRKSVQELTSSHTQLLIDKGAMDGNTNAGIEKKKAEVTAKGQAVIEKIRAKSEELALAYNTDKENYDFKVQEKIDQKELLDNVESDISQLSFLGDVVELTSGFVDGLKEAYKLYFGYDPIEAPPMPIQPGIDDGKLILIENVSYHADFAPLLEAHKAVAVEYNAIKPEPVDYTEIDEKIEKLATDIEKANAHNTLVSRYELNREWVEADAVLNEKRQELAKLYAQVDTGVKGLKMKPFFNDEKMEIKTVYTGEYDIDFFKPGESEDDQLLLSYSSTQRPIIGVLLQVARLKLKSKMLPYIFIDDVPMDNRSREIIARIAEENGLTIITSMTGDYEKDKLTENEILIEGGEVFFSK